MEIECRFDNGKHIVTVSLPSHQRRKYKEFLINEFERWNNEDKDNPKLYKLLFAGGEWEIPKPLVIKMYKAIISSYSDLKCFEFKKNKYSKN